MLLALALAVVVAVEVMAMCLEAGIAAACSTDLYHGDCGNGSGYDAIAHKTTASRTESVDHSHLTNWLNEIRGESAFWLVIAVLVVPD